VATTSLNIEKIRFITKTNCFLVASTSGNSRKRRKFKDMTTEILIYLREGLPEHEMVGEIFLLVPFNSKKNGTNTNETVKRAVIAGLGCSIMPLIGIKMSS
jgi:hypothetical protein